MIILAADIEQFTDALYDKAYELVPAYRRKKTDKMKMPADKKRSIAAGIILNRAVKMFDFATDTTKTADEIEYTELKSAVYQYEQKYDYNVEISEKGKPYFTDYPQIHYNIAHSGQYAVCVVSDHNVGIDIEGLRKSKDAIGIAKHFFSPDECSWLNIADSGSVYSVKNLSEEELHSRFLRLWTLKEAYAKVTGDGISKGMSKGRFIYKDNRLQFEDESLNLMYDIKEYTLGKNKMRMAVITEN